MICEIDGCEEKATVQVRDIEEIEPSADHWREFNPGNKHTFCDKHEKQHKQAMSKGMAFPIKVIPSSLSSRAMGNGVTIGQQLTHEQGELGIGCL